MQWICILFLFQSHGLRTTNVTMMLSVQSSATQEKRSEVDPYSQEEASHSGSGLAKGNISTKHSSMD